MSLIKKWFSIGTWLTILLAIGLTIITVVNGYNFEMVLRMLPLSLAGFLIATIPLLNDYLDNLFKQTKNKEIQ